jgi:hypothetical protein
VSAPVYFLGVSGEFTRPTPTIRAGA